MVLFDFSSGSTLSNWYVMDDVVMGGRSQGQFDTTNEGFAQFYGNVSLENNGGFSSVRLQPGKQEIKGYTQCRIRLKGDGKRYQFRVKRGLDDRHSYIKYFETTGDWQTIIIPLEECYPTFRGRRLDMDNYNVDHLSEISFLVGNKKAESFCLILDWMWIE